MRNRILVVTALTCFSASAMAVPINFDATYDIDARDSDPGLVIETLGLETNPFDFTLDIDGVTTYSTNLFRIWTDEGSVNYGEDTVSYPISVDFAFSAPEAGNVTATGTTSGDYFALFFQRGELDWDAPSWNYGFGNGGLLQISLFDIDFNEGLLGLKDGYRHSGDVGARFTLLQAPVSVPEPGSLVLLGAGLVGFGLVRRRRNHA